MQMHMHMHMHMHMQMHMHMHMPGRMQYVDQGYIPMFMVMVYHANINRNRIYLSAVGPSCSNSKGPTKRTSPYIYIYIYMCKNQLYIYIYIYTYIYICENMEKDVIVVVVVVRPSVRTSVA